MTTTMTNSVDTLLNWTKSRNPDLTAAEIVEILNQSNELTPHMVWEEGNAPLGNRTSVRISLPTVSSRQIGVGIPTSTSRNAQFDDAMSLLDVLNEVDIVLARLQADVGSYRIRAAVPFFEAMVQKFNALFFYGDSSKTPSDFFGMAPRYATVSTSTAANAKNVLDAGGTSTVNTSIWFLTLGDRSLTGIFPKGSPAGIVHKDWGEQLTQVTAGYGATKLPVFQDQYQWSCGIALKDWRYNGRIANIDTTNLVNENGAANLIKLLIKMFYRLPQLANPASTTGNPMSSFYTAGKRVIVCNRTVREMLHIQAMDKANNTLRLDDIDGQKVLSFMDVPIINSDQLLNTEAQVV